MCISYKTGKECVAWYIRTTPEGERVYIRQHTSACVIAN